MGRSSLAAAVIFLVSSIAQVNPICSLQLMWVCLAGLFMPFKPAIFLRQQQVEPETHGTV
jgi:hypothetical protein